MSAKETESRVTVCLTVDFDAVCLWMSWGSSGARSLSRGDFGASVGVPRILDLIARHEIKTTWFIPGHSADTYAELTERVASEGHEIGNHGYLHEDFSSLSDNEARGTLKKANQTIERITGQRPKGIRIPAGDFDDSLFSAVIEEGFVYDSSLVGEYHPWLVRTGGSVRHDSGNEPGVETKLVEIPLSFVMNDFSYLEFNYGSPQLVGLMPPTSLEKIWCDQFDYMYENVPGGILTLTVHPQSIGWGSRIGILDRFIQHCLDCTGTSFKTMGQVAGEFLADRARA